MSPEKLMKFRGRPARKGLLFMRADAGRSLPPFFLTSKVRKSIEKLLPAEHHQRLRLYFDTFGCFHCLHKNVIYGGNGFCCRCLTVIRRRLRKLDKQLRARFSDPSPDMQECYLRPYNSARHLLADLIPKLGKRSSQRKPELKAPTKVYMKWLTKRV